MSLDDLAQATCVNHNDFVSYANPRRLVCMHMDEKVSFPSWTAADPKSMTSRAVG